MKVFKPLGYDEMKTALQEWLSPEDSQGEGDIISEPAEKFDSDAKEETKSNYSLNVKEKSTKIDEFDKMFDKEDDDLPF